MAKRTYGCTSVVNAVNLQYELAGHGLYTNIHRAQGGLWLCEHTIKRPEVCTVTPPTAFRKAWLEQAPRSLCQCNQGRLPCDCGKPQAKTSIYSWCD